MLVAEPHARVSGAYLLDFDAIADGFERFYGTHAGTWEQEKRQDARRRHTPHVTAIHTVPSS